jgi:6-phosphogluconolactonase
VAAKVENVAWLAFSHGHDSYYSASELDTFDGKPTGEVASFRLAKAETLQPLSARNSAGTGTCHVAVDRDGTHAACRRLHGRERGQLPH